MTVFASNYIISSKEWKPLSDIMNQDYDHEAVYKIYINDLNLFPGTYFKARLGFTHRMTVPTADDRGSEYISGSTIDIPKDQGDDIYLRAIGNSVNIEITEVNVS